MPDLRRFLEQAFAARGGAMTFANFMALALYDPVFGYYTSGIADVGRRGDFATSATLSDGLGRTIAGWIRGEIEHHRWREPIPLIEIGGGNGALAAAIWKSLGWWRRRSLRYHLVEVSPILRDRQRRRLGNGVTAWHETPADALAACGGRALVFSNELVDAFPANWFRFSEGNWREVWVCLEKGGLCEEFREPPSGWRPEDFSATRLANPSEGQRIELHGSYRDWLKSWAPSWKAGSILTIDYGAANASGVYSRRPGGTMRAYCKQERIEGAGIYSRFGKQDLTCDVVFDDLVAWGNDLGWNPSFLETQAAFLGRYGVCDNVLGGKDVGESFLVLSQRNAPSTPSDITG